MKMAIVEYELLSEDGDRVVVSGDTEEPEDIEVDFTVRLFRSFELWIG